MSPQHTLILVTGATGKQGGVTARKLLADGRGVRALVRDAQSPAARELAAAGAELAVGDFDSPDTISAALDGVTGLFAVPPAAYSLQGWDVELEATRGEALVDAACRAGVEQIVFTGIASLGDNTSWGAAGKKRIEDAIIASGLSYTLLRPVRFMENYLLRTSPVDGIFGGVHRHLFPAAGPMQIIAIADIGDIAALAFADPDRFHGRVLELAGDALAPPAAAEAISKATGHQVRYQEVTEAEADALGAEIGNTWRLMRHTGGWHADVAEIREIHPGLRTFDTWLAETGAAQIKALLDGEKVTPGR
ncbi:NmrA family NAD(P)-binding protein [Nocardia amamiensis]|uniref:NmrA family NAD(P)-binding protein n=1 Tax=Nocardia amamiensis TaxID=404578 RepID=UPI00082B449E|nr:NmrA family NAD(P)-binding protein [Nocardia amamiensis]